MAPSGLSSGRRVCCARAHPAGTRRSRRCSKQAGSITRSFRSAKRCMRPVTFAAAVPRCGNRTGGPTVPKHMRVCALLLLIATVACGGAATLSSPEPSATAGTATIAPAGTVTATAITGTIVPGTLPPNPTPAPSPTPSPAPGGLTQAQLRYRLVDQFGRLLFCDPDYYPVARADEGALAHERLPDIQKDAPTFSAILSHLRITPAASYTNDQELAIYRDWKMLNAIHLDPVNGGFHFLGVFGTPQQANRVDGTIDQRGIVSVASRTPSGQPPCPICLARGTRIATPSGDVAVENLKIGDLIWTTDGTGSRVSLPLVEVGSTPVPPAHRVVHLLLSDGRTVNVSPGHPTADGRKVGELVAGDRYDGGIVLGAELTPYTGGATFDVLPAGATGFYWANSVLLGSTLR
ncbi:MAG: hypothetical protein E6H89_09540 [Chloroflexi bacterium]|nr:MAG: hypothetical protein E6H89_09540 [Chloroflexota bacterium]